MNDSPSTRTSPIALPIMLAVGAMALAIAVVGILGSGPMAFDEGPAGKSGSSSTLAKPSAAQPPGAVIVEVPWKHFAHINRFKLTNQLDEPFDSAELAGKPYVVSFFFAQCPSICRDLNNQIDRLNTQLRKEDISFVSVTVDPEEDTPDVLKRYAQDYDTTPDRWAFVTGQMYQIKQVGEQQFGVVIDKDTHTDNILLVDKWGRYRDRFKWDDPYDMKRFLQVAKEACTETEPPLTALVKTRNAMVGQEPTDPSTVQFLREFHLTDQSGEHFFSRDLTGSVWIANFFFSTCPGICKEQTRYLTGLQSRLGEQETKIVSISTTPDTDTPSVLNKYAKDADADLERWRFLTGQSRMVPRIGSEFFSAMSGDDHHSSLLYVVDRWQNVRGQFDWRDPKQEVAMLKLIEELWIQKTPPATFKRINADREAADETDTEDEESESEESEDEAENQ